VAAGGRAQGGSSRLSLWRRTGGGQAPDERKGRSQWPYLFLAAADRRRPNERRGRGGLLFSIWRSTVGRALGATGASPRGGVGRKGRRRRTAWPHAEGVAADLVEPVRSLPDRARDLSFVVSPLPKSPLTTSRLRPIAPSAFAWLARAAAPTSSASAYNIRINQRLLDCRYLHSWSPGHRCFFSQGY
jgi:hypothetical protein